jgi:hypothetical protein
MSVLVEAVSRRWQSPGWFSNLGAYMRLEVPLVMPRALKAYVNDPDVIKDYALYTDADVIFNNDVELNSSFVTPPFFSIGAELNRGTPGNTGVMFMNVTAFAEHRQGIIDFGVGHKWADRLVYDQNLLNWYASERKIQIPYLPDVYNWKVSRTMLLPCAHIAQGSAPCGQCYWGGSDDLDKIKLVHWHGPKPDRGASCYVEHVHDYRSACPMYGAYHRLMELATKADEGRLYREMLAIHRKYLNDSRSP